MRWILGGRSAAVAILAPAVTVLRYAVFAGLVYLFLRLGLGDIWGLLVGVGAGIAAYMTWQTHHARTRRSDKV